MRAIPKKIFILLTALTLFVGSQSHTLAKELSECLMCGMDLSKYTHVKYTVVDIKGKKYVTCGVQCGLLLQINLKNKFKSATMTDLLTHKSLPAEKGWYVFKSSVITDMGPGLIGFANKSRAEQFIKGFGGELVNYQQALDKAQKGFR